MIHFRLFFDYYSLNIILHGGGNKARNFCYENTLRFRLEIRSNLGLLVPELKGNFWKQYCLKVYHADFNISQLKLRVAITAAKAIHSSKINWLRSVSNIAITTVTWMRHWCLKLEQVSNTILTTWYWRNDHSLLGFLPQTWFHTENNITNLNYGDYATHKSD